MRDYSKPPTIITGTVEPHVLAVLEDAARAARISRAALVSKIVVERLEADGLLPPDTATLKGRAFSHRRRITEAGA